MLFAALTPTFALLGLTIVGWLHGRTDGWIYYLAFDAERIGSWLAPPLLYISSAIILCYLGLASTFVFLYQDAI